MGQLRIRSIKFKNGGEIRLLPIENSNFLRVDLGWGEVVFRCYDNEKIARRDALYMCEAAKHTILTGEVE